MRSSRSAVLRATLASCSIAVFASCSATPEQEVSSQTEHATEGTRSPIIGGTKATDYPEAVLVDMLQNGQQTSACSGALIAPRVVLTAGHCVHGFNGWKITAPHAGGQKASSSKSAVYDYTNGGDYVDPNQHDVGLVFLATPITLTAYPKIATAVLASGTKIVNVGRIKDGQFSTSSLFVSAPIAISMGASYGFPFDYVSKEVIESGDSGGPDLLPGSPHVIVAVNSGAGGGTEVLARVDLIAPWIAEQVAANGGGGDVDPPDPVDPGGDPVDPGEDPGEDPGGDPGEDPGGDPGEDPGGDPSDPCGGVSYEGKCDGDTVVWCECSKYLQEIDCAAYGMTCGYDDWSGLYDCL